MLALTFATQAQWFAQTSGTTQQLWAVHFSGPDTGIAVGAQGTILRTLNGGTSWASVPSGTTQTLRGTCFTGNGQGFAVGGNSILKTTDHGATWAVQSWPVPTGSALTSYGLMGIQCTGSGSIHVYGERVDFLTTRNITTGIRYNLNGFGNWQDVPTAGGLAVFFVNDILGFTSNWTRTSLGYSGELSRTTDGGATWKSVFNTGTGANYYGSIVSLGFASATTGYGLYKPFTETDPAHFFRTSDGGATWTLFRSYPALLSSIHFSGNTGWIVGAHGTILLLKSADASMGLQASGTTVNLRGIYALDSNRAWVVGDTGVILKTGTGGGPVTAMGTGPALAERFGIHLEKGQLGFSLPHPSTVSFTLFDHAGRMVGRFPARHFEAGEHRLDLGRDNLASGVYVVDFEVDGARYAIRL